MTKHKVIPMLTTNVRGNNNPGDTFIGVGMQWLWEYALEDTINWFLISKYGQADIEKHLDIVKRAGLLVYGGMPQYNNYNDWKFWHDDEFWSEIINPNKIPVAIMAGGSGYPDASMSPMQFAEYCANDELTAHLIKQRAKHALCFTTRDEHSHELLNKLSIPNDYLACSATFASRYCGHDYEQKPYIGLVPPSPKSLPGKYCGENKDDFVVKEWLKLLHTLRHEGLEPKIVCHWQYEYDLFKDVLSDKSLFYSNDFNAYLNFYGRCHTVVSARLHGVLPAFGIPGTKAMGVSIDTRGHAVTYFDKIPAIPYDQFNTENIMSILPTLKPSEESDFTEVIDKYKTIILDAYSKI